MCVSLSLAIVAVTVGFAVMQGQAPSPITSGTSPEKTVWVELAPDRDDLQFKVLLPALPEMSRVLVEGTDASNSLWWLEHGDVIYSVFLQRGNKDTQSSVEQTLEICQDNFDHGRHVSRKKVELQHVPSGMSAKCFEQQIRFPIWKRIRPTTTDREGRFVLGEMDDIEGGESYPAGIAFQLVCRCEQPNGTFTVILQIEMRQDTYDQGSAHADANVRKLFDSFALRDATSGAKARLSMLRPRIKIEKRNPG